MHVIRNDKVVFCDVDDTIIIWPGLTKSVGLTEEFELMGIDLSLNGDTTQRFLPNRDLIEFLHGLKAQGISLVVWSQAGYRWAEYVVNSLGISDLFDAVVSKPYLMLDDCPVTEWTKSKWIGPSDS